MKISSGSIGTVLDSGEILTFINLTGICFMSFLSRRLPSQTYWQLILGPGFASRIQRLIDINISSSFLSGAGFSFECPVCAQYQIGKKRQEPFCYVRALFSA